MRREPAAACGIPSPPGGRRKGHNLDAFAFYAFNL
jgi:hypothetical protein